MPTRAWGRSTTPSTGSARSRCRRSLLCGFLKRGMHPGGGHFVILSRLIGREAAAAMALFGEEINGLKAVELGLAWESLYDAAVEDRALELAARVAADPQLARGGG